MSFDSLVKRIELKSKEYKGGKSIFFFNFSLHTGNVFSALLFYINSKQLDISRHLFLIDEKVSKKIQQKIKENKEKVDKENLESKKRAQKYGEQEQLKTYMKPQLIKKIVTNSFLDEIIAKLIPSINVIS